MKRVSLNEIGFILHPPGRFVKSRRLTRSSKKTGKTDLSGYVAPIIRFASDDDIFFPANRVFPRAKEIFANMPELIKIPGNHLPSDDTMAFVCERIGEGFNS